MNFTNDLVSFTALPSIRIKFILGLAILVKHGVLNINGSSTSLFLVGSKQGFLYINYYEGTLLCVNDSNNLIFKNDSDYDCIKTGSLDAISEITAQNDLKVFPNPATDNVSIEKNSIIKLVEIYDLCGNKLAYYCPNQNSYRITFTNLKKGIYLIRIDSVVKKLIIE